MLLKASQLMVRLILTPTYCFRGLILKRNRSDSQVQKRTRPDMLSSRIRSLDFWNFHKQNLEYKIEFSVPTKLRPNAQKSTQIAHKKLEHRNYEICGSHPEDIRRHSEENAEENGEGSPELTGLDRWADNSPALTSEEEVESPVELHSINVTSINIPSHIKVTYGKQIKVLTYIRVRFPRTDFVHTSAILLNIMDRITFREKRTVDRPRPWRPDRSEYLVVKLKSNYAFLR